MQPVVSSANIPVMPLSWQKQGASPGAQGAGWAGEGPGEGLGPGLLPGEGEVGEGEAGEGLLQGTLMTCT